MTAQPFAGHAFFKTGYFVDGKWHNAQETFDVLNPATGEVIAQVAKAGKKRDRGRHRRGQPCLPCLARKNCERTF